MPTPSGAGSRPGYRTAICEHCRHCETPPTTGRMLPLCCHGGADAGWNRPEKPLGPLDHYGVALMDQGEGPVRLVQRRPRRQSGRGPL
jgi:hypothetical protein